MENRTRQHVLGTSNTKLSLVDKTEGKDFAIVHGSKDFKWYSIGRSNGTCRMSENRKH